MMPFLLVRVAGIDLPQPDYSLIPGNLREIKGNFRESPIVFLLIKLKMGEKRVPIFQP
jgi:hypothetical protein